MQHDLLSGGETFAVTGAQQRLPDTANMPGGSTLFGDSGETVLLDFAQQQVPFDLFSAEQRHPDR